MPRENDDSLLTPTRWSRIQRVLDEALALPDDQRSGYLRHTCGSDEGLRQEVEALIRAAESPAAIDRPAVRLLPKGREERVGERIGAYRLVRPLTGGGMGEVFLAVRDDDTYWRQVAVKILPRGLANQDMVRRFHSERQILAHLDHPNIARLFEGGTTADGLPYLVMEYIEGRPIDRFCSEDRLSLEDRLELFTKVCRAVQFAHQNLIVHRDLKPSNILVTTKGEPKLLDFGIAKLLGPPTLLPGSPPTAEGLLPLTPEYASPEQVSGGAITTASDVYSLGVLFFELLTGERPYPLDRRDPRAAVREICETRPSLPSSVVRAAGTSGRQGLAEEPRKLARKLTGDLDNIVLKALAKESGRRYASAEQLAADIDRYRRGLPVEARADTFTYRAAKFVRRHRLGVGAALAVFVVMAGFLTLLLSQRSEVLRQEARATEVSDFLTDLFIEPDPDHARGRKTTAEDLLRRGARSIENDLEKSPEVRADLLETMGRSSMHLGLYSEADRLFRASLEIRRGLYREDHPEVAQVFDALAELGAYQGDYGGAITACRQALDMRRRLRDPEHPEVVESLARLGRLLHLEGDLDGATERLRQALSLARRLAEAESLASVLERFAMLQADRAQSAAAEAMYLEALDIYRRVLGLPHRRVARVLGSLGVLKQARGEHAAAEAYFRQAEAMQRQLFDGDHSELARTLHNLAAALDERGEGEEAEGRFREALEMRRRVLGDDHPKVASTLARLARLAHKRGDLEAADDLFRQALTIRRESLGDNHADTARSLRQLAQLRVDQGAHGEARELYSRALDITRQVLGEDHPEVAVTLNNLAELTLLRGDMAGAAERFEAALGILHRSPGSDPVDLAMLEHNLATVRHRLGDLEAAEASYQGALELARGALGDDHPRLGLIRLGLASVRRDRGDPAAARTLAMEAYDGLASTLPAPHPWRRAALRLVAKCHLDLGAYAAAEPLLLELEGLTSGESAAADERREVRELLATLYEAWGRPQAAAVYRAPG